MKHHLITYPYNITTTLTIFPLKICQLHYYTNVVDEPFAHTVVLTHHCTFLRETTEHGTDAWCVELSMAWKRINFRHAAPLILSNGGFK